MDNVGGAKQAISRTTSLTTRPERRPSVRSNVSRKSTRYVCLCSWSQLNLELSTNFREVSQCLPHFFVKTLHNMGT